MAFTPSGPSIRLAVTDAGQRANITQAVSQCRVWNEGPGAARIRYGVGALDADDTDMIFPAGLIEIHMKSNAPVLAAKCATGETAVLHIIAGSGD